MTRDNGGPAFPVTEYSEEKSVGSTHGLSLRDYFAGQALAALVTEALRLDHTRWLATAEHAYVIADAMLAERNKP